MINHLLTVLAALSLVACSCREERLLKEELLLRAKGFDKEVKMILPKNLNEEVVHCSDYGLSCMNGYIMSIKGLELILVEFKHDEDARKMAYALNGYYKDNWFFDDVKGEPLLEKFVVEVFQAHKGRD